MPSMAWPEVAKLRVMDKDRVLYLTLTLRAGGHLGELSSLWHQELLRPTVYFWMKTPFLPVKHL